MVELWYAIAVLMLGLYVVLDGWDIGAGALHLVVGRSDAARRTVMAAIGPFWLWNEVWLIAAGGVMVLAFPFAMGLAFSGLYLAMMLLLWAIIGRGVALELAGHLRERLWRSFWDAAFAACNVLLALLLGAALGNVLRGLPIGAGGWFSLPFFTNFGVGGELGILDWYTLSTAAFSLICLAAHGASFLALRTSGDVNVEASRKAKPLWFATLAGLPVLAGMTSYVRPELFARLVSRPPAWGFAAAAFGGVWAIVTGLRARREQRTFLGGCALQAGLLGCAAACTYPVLLKSTLSEQYSITIFSGVAPEHSLSIGLVWWPVAALMTLSYVLILAHHFGGKVGAAFELEGYGTAGGPLPGE